MATSFNFGEVVSVIIASACLPFLPETPIQLLVEGLSTKEIALTLKISEKTVRNHISNVMQKLGVKGRANAVIELLKLKEIKL